MSTTERQALAEVVSAMLAPEPEGLPEGELDTRAWTTLRDAGMHLLLVDPALGGSGGTFADLAVVLRAAGAHASSVPLAEASVAAALLARCGMPPPEGLLTLQLVDSPRPDSSPPVPFGRAADHLVRVEAQPDGGALVRLADARRATATHGANLAGEARDHLSLRDDAFRDVGLLPSWWDVRLLTAACRAMLIAGAVERIRLLTVRHATERHQFGQPLARFQAVQDLLVQTVAAAHTAGAICDHLAERMDPDASALSAGPAVAAARVVTGEAALSASRAAHQVHGAMGFTTEHPLHRFTRRALAWRDEDGSDVTWRRRLGARLRDGGSATLWALVTDDRGPLSARSAS